ncbi:MAG: hypothetical protein JWN84_3015 [Nocardioides sp.]|nr:hypothetical protein [Nocardioides sp.]
MSQSDSEREPEQQEIAETQERIDAQVEGEGLEAEAEAGLAEENGISQG